MTSGLRAFLGALAGALVVLAAHPGSRPYLIEGVFGSSRVVRELPLLNESVDLLPEPRTPEIAAWWLLVGAERETTGRPITPDQRRLMVEVAQSGARQDPQNAFWRQAEAAFQSRLGNEDAAAKAWILASAAPRWNDLQGERIQQVLARARLAAGRQLGWHYALGRIQRSDANGRLLFETAAPWVSPEAGLDARLRGVRNGTLIRNGGRLVTTSEHGARLVEASLSGSAARPRDIAERRGEMIDRLFEDGRAEDAQFVAQASVDNDAWTAFVNRRTAEERFGALATEAVLAAVLPSAILASALVGALIWAIGAAFDWWPALRVLFRPKPVLVIGVTGGITVYLAWGLVLPAVWATTALTAVALVPDRTRQFTPPALPLYARRTLTFLALALLGALVYAMVSVTGPAVALAGQTWLLPPTNGFALGIAIAIVPLGLVLAGTACYAFARKYRVEDVMPMSLRWTGGVLTVVALTATVLLTPVAVARDQAVSRPLAEIFRNEPTFYLVRSQ